MLCLITYTCQHTYRVKIHGFLRSCSLHVVSWHRLFSQVRWGAYCLSSWLLRIGCDALLRCAPPHTVTTALGCASHGCSLLLLPRFPDSRLRAALRLLAALRPAMRPPSRHPHLVFVCVYVFTHIIRACDFITCVSLSIYSNKLITYSGTGIDEKTSQRHADRQSVERT